MAIERRYNLDSSVTSCLKVRIASPKSNPRVCSIDSDQDMLVDLLRKLARVIVQRSLPLASVPQRFPAHRLGFSSSLVVTCGFVTVDSVQGRPAGAPGKCRRYSVQDWPSTRTGFAPAI